MQIGASAGRSGSTTTSPTITGCRARTTRSGSTRDPDQLNSADARFPGAPNYRKFVSTRPSRSFTLRSTLASNLVSELRGGITRGGASYFGQIEQRPADVCGYRRLRDRVRRDDNIGLDQLAHRQQPELARAPTLQHRRDADLAEGHAQSVRWAARVFLGRAWENAQTMVPGISLGFDTTQDPANAFFSDGELPGRVRRRS